MRKFYPLLDKQICNGINIAYDTFKTFGYVTYGSCLPKNLKIKKIPDDTQWKARIYDFFVIQFLQKRKKEKIRQSQYGPMFVKFIGKMQRTKAHVVVGFVNLEMNTEVDKIRLGASLHLKRLY